MISRIVESFQQANWVNDGQTRTKRAGDWTGTIVESSDGWYQYFLTAGETARDYASYELVDQGRATSLLKAMEKLDWVMEWHSNERA